jgi:hypothetical protein
MRFSFRSPGTSQPHNTSGDLARANRLLCLTPDVPYCATSLFALRAGAATLTPEAAPGLGRKVD